MVRDHHKWFSRSLNRDMELLVFGHGGPPVMVFPTSMGAFFEYEDRGMVGALQDKLEHGGLRLFCLSSVDSESWYCKKIHPRHRVERHLHYEDYILNEAVPLIRHLTRTDTITDRDGDSASNSASINIGAAISFEDDGPSVVESSHYTVFSGPALRCKVQMERLAGFQQNPRFNARTPRVSILYVARFGESGMWIPVRLESDSSFGLVIGHLVEVDAPVRPLGPGRRPAS